MDVDGVQFHVDIEQCCTTDLTPYSQQVCPETRVSLKHEPWIMGSQLKLVETLIHR